MANKYGNRTFKEFLWEMLSEKDYVSSKRVAGMIMIFVALGCTIFLAVKDGGTSTVENLIQTAFIVGTSLLGLTSVTSIWKGGKVSASNIQENLEQPQNVQSYKEKKKQHNVEEETQQQDDSDTEDDCYKVDSYNEENEKY